MALNRKEEGVDFLYPDLLSKEGLLHTLRKRYVQIPDTDLETLDKQSLVELYNQYILPLPQRKYRDNLRGREMKKQQIIRDKKRKFVLNDEDDATSVGKKMRLSQESPTGPAKGLVNHFSTSSPAGSRLKPPPSCIDTSKKVVKLGSSSSKSSLSPSKKEESERSSLTTITVSHKVIKLEDDHKSNDAAKRPASEDKEENEKSPKGKIKKISWP